MSFLGRMVADARGPSRLPGSGDAPRPAALGGLETGRRDVEPVALPETHDAVPATALPAEHTGPLPAAAHLPAATQRPVQTEADVSAHMPAAMERPVEASGQPYVETISPDSAYAGITADTEPVDEQVVVPGSMPRAAGMVDESLPVTEETPLWPAGRPVTAVNPPEQTNMTQESPAAPASYNSLVVAAGQPERAAATGSRRNTVIASPEDAAIPAPGQLHRERRDDIDGEKLPEIQIHGTSARADNRPEAAVVSPRIGSDAPDMGKESPKAAMPSRDDGPAKGRQAPGQNRPAAIAASENGRGSDNETAAKGERGSGVLWHQPPRPAVAAELRPPLMGGAPAAGRAAPEPRVEIGQIDILIESPSRPVPAPAPALPPAGMASRLYLRRL